MRKHATEQGNNMRSTGDSWKASLEYLKTNNRKYTSPAIDKKIEYAVYEGDIAYGNDMITTPSTSDMSNEKRTWSPVGEEKFDLHTARERLRSYQKKLQSEQKECKAKETALALDRLGVNPDSINKRFEDLHQMGKTKIISEKENSKKNPKISREFRWKNKSNSSSPSPQEVIDRLYGRSIPMQEFGRGRREEILKARAASQSKSPIRIQRTSPSSSPSPTRRRSKRYTSSSVSPSPEDVMKRLYNRSLPMQEFGRERREEVSRRRESPNPRRVLKVPSPSRRKGSANLSLKSSNSSASPTPQEIINRLYNRSLVMQEFGKERRQEASRRKV